MTERIEWAYHDGRNWCVVVDERRARQMERYGLGVGYRTVTESPWQVVAGVEPDHD